MKPSCNEPLFERARLQPCREAKKINAALAAEGLLSRSVKVSLQTVMFMLQGIMLEFGIIEERTIFRARDTAADDTK
jgi:hypothetical protein